MRTNQRQPTDVVPPVEEPTSAPTLTRLALPWLPPLTPEVRRLREEGVHAHHVRFDNAAVEQERQAMIAGLARLPSKRAVTWYWRACTIDGVYEVTHAWSEAELRQELDRAGQFPCWEDFERETIQRPLEELHAHTDFQIRHRVQRRGGKVVSVRFTLQKPPDGNGVDADPLLPSTVEG